MIKPEDIKETEVKEEVIEVVDDTCEEEKTGIFSKAKNGVKKHGKKIAALAVLGTVGLIGYALGSKSSNNASDEYDDDIVADLDYSEFDDNTTE